MAIWIGAGGVWKKIPTPSTGAGGAWKKLTGAWIGAGGAWKKFFAPITLLSGNYTRLTNAPASYIVNSDGNIYAPSGLAIVSQYSWSGGASPSGYEVRVDVTSGSFSGGNSTGAWLNCGTTRQWDRGAALNTFQTVSFTVQIRDASSLTVLASASITLTCDRT
jgi:hypothetical protein